MPVLIFGLERSTAEERQALHFPGGIQPTVLPFVYGGVPQMICCHSEWSPRAPTLVASFNTFAAPLLHSLTHGDHPSSLDLDVMMSFLFPAWPPAPPVVFSPVAAIPLPAPPSQT